VFESAFCHSSIARYVVADDENKQPLVNVLPWFFQRVVGLLAKGNAVERFWRNYSIEGRLSVFRLLFTRQALLLIPAGSWRVRPDVV
jgi:hypothetical protein